MALQLNGLFYRAAGREARPVFFDLDAFPALQEISRNHSIIRRELDEVLLRKERLPRYRDIDPASAGITGEGEGDWRVFMLYAMGAKPEKNRRLVPETVKLLDRVPNLFQAFFSILEPGKKIPPHRGSYLGYIRYHLGLRIPQKNPPRIRVHDRFHTWSSGEAILFDDTWEHEVENESDDIRVVLIADILRPMPPIPHALNWMTTNVLVRHTYGRAVLERLRGD
jgi:aspartyl/asparaginyl beta-hydroxylase (cupin superfamily)